MLLVGSYRSEDSEGPIIRALHESVTPELDFREIALEALSEEESQELAATLITGDPGSVGAKAALAIAQEVGGSPLLLSEIARHLRDASAGRLNASLDITLEDVLGRRIDKLPSQALRLLRTIAAVGRPVDPEFIMSAARISGARDAMMLLSSAHMVNIHRGERTTVEVFHQRLREAVMIDLASSLLGEIHQDIADAIAKSDEQDPELLLDIAIATGSDKTTGYLLQAAEHAEQCLAFERAADLYKQVLLVTEEEQRPARQRRLADALCLAGHGKEAATHYLLLAEASSGIAQLDLLRLAADNLLRTGHIEEGLKELGAVLAKLGIKLPRSRSGAIASLLVKRVRLSLRRGRYQSMATKSKAKPSEQALCCDTRPWKRAGAEWCSVCLSESPSLCSRPPAKKRDEAAPVQPP